MLIEFNVENFRSIKEPIKFSMLASNDNTLETNFTHFKYNNENLKILKTAVILGPNASGKSNIINAMEYFFDSISYSHNLEPDDDIPALPFLLDEETQNQPSQFSIIFLYENIKYIYGFSMDSTKVYEEYLYSFPNGKRSTIFERSETYNYKKAKQDLILKTGKNRLYLPIAYHWNDKTIQKPYEWLKSFFIVSEENTNKLEELLIESLKAKNNEYLENLKKHASMIDAGIHDLSIEYIPITDDLVKKHLKENLKPEYLKQIIQELKTLPHLRSHHLFKTKEGKAQKYDLPFELESKGTRRYLELIGPIEYAIKNNRTVIIDELDTALHTTLLTSLLKFFHSKSNQSQLIFTTHNTNIIDLELFRRDQIWFTEKHKDGQYTELYSLSDITGVRKTDKAQKKYLEGRYGAIPFINLDGV